VVAHQHLPTLIFLCRKYFQRTRQEPGDSYTQSV